MSARCLVIQALASERSFKFGISEISRLKNIATAEAALLREDYVRLSKSALVRVSRQVSPIISFVAGYSLGEAWRLFILRSSHLSPCT